MERFFENIKTAVPKALMILTIIGLLAVSLPTQKSYSCATDCTGSEHGRLQNLIEEEHEITRTFITSQFMQHQLWFMYDFYLGYILPSMMVMTETLTAVGMHQMFILGSFFDAQQQIEAQRLFLEFKAKAHKNYQPSLDLCTIGTAARGLAASDRTAEANALLLTRRSQNRQLGNSDTLGVGGTASDRYTRTEIFKAAFCDPHDGNSSWASICTGSFGPTYVDTDINYSKTIGNALTINADFSDGLNPTIGEITLLAMANNLYAHDLMPLLSREIIDKNINQDDYMELRSLVAKRSVAENSFYAIAGMKTAGSATANAVGDYLQVVMEQLGAPSDDARVYIGENPSYYALMNVLAQKIYQSADFYTNLYDKPANVLRKDVAMQAIDLMLARDTYKSELRYEALLALWLEMEASDYQNDIMNRLGWLVEESEFD